MKNREIIKDILVNLVLFLLLLSFLISVQLIINNELPWLYLLFIFPFFGLMLVRKRVHVLTTFFVLHGIIIILPVIFLRNITEIIPITLVAILSTIYSIRVRTRKEWRPYTREAIIITAIFATMFFVVTVPFGAGIEGVDRLFFGVTFTSIAAMLLVIQMDNIDSRIETLPNQLKNTAPIRNVLFANNTLISWFLTFLMAFGMLSLVAPSMWRVMRLGVFLLMQGLRTFLMILAAPFLLEEPPPAYIPEPFPDYDRWLPEFRFNVHNEEALDALAQLMEDGGYMVEGETWLSVFFVLAGILILSLMIVLFFIIRAAIRVLIKNFFNKNKDDESESLIPDDAKGKLAFFFKDIASFLPRFRSDVKNPVRRSFIKKVNSHIKKGVRIRLSDTHDIIADKIRKNENIDELTMQYEKARYGL